MRTKTSQTLGATMKTEVTFKYNTIKSNWPLILVTRHGLECTSRDTKSYTPSTYLCTLTLAHDRDKRECRLLASLKCTDVRTGEDRLNSERRGTHCDFVVKLDREEGGESVVRKVV